MASAEGLQSVVKTMKALAAVNIRQYEKAVESLIHYNATIEMGLQVLLSKRPELIARARLAPKKDMGGIIFGSDQGMCGQFNEQIVSFACDKMDELEIEKEKRLLIAVGERVASRLEAARQAVKEQFSIPGSVDGITPLVQDILTRIVEWHSERGLNLILLFHNRPISGASYRQHTLRLLPLDQEWLKNLAEKKWQSRALPQFTMDWNRLFWFLIRQYLFFSIYRAYAESLTSENASRLASMQAAEKNIEKHLENLEGQYHRQRQMSITEELFDIIAGFEALTNKGN
jgi:F-type H+-transporting ATPase subunit gamma